jgi:hypothetical protein
MEALHVLGLVALAGAAYYMHIERKARKEAKRRALLKSTEQVIQQVLLEKRHSTKGGK